MYLQAVSSQIQLDLASRGHKPCSFSTPKLTGGTSCCGIASIFDLWVPFLTSRGPLPSCVYRSTLVCFLLRNLSTPFLLLLTWTSSAHPIFAYFITRVVTPLPCYFVIDGYLGLTKNPTVSIVKVRVLMRGKQVQSLL